MPISAYAGDLNYSKSLVDNQARAASSSSHSMVTDWFRRADGFERLEQSSDGENELVNNAV